MPKFVKKSPQSLEIGLRVVKHLPYLLFVHACSLSKPRSFPLCNCAIEAGWSLTRLGPKLLRSSASTWLTRAFCLVRVSSAYRLSYIPASFLVR